MILIKLLKLKSVIVGKGTTEYSSVKGRYTIRSEKLSLHNAVLHKQMRPNRS